MSKVPSASSHPIKVSFEFFPPKNETMEDKLWESIGRLKPLNPHFVSVTYGAGGSTRDRTHRTVRRIVEETDMAPAAHLTCVSATKAEVDEVIREYKAVGVRHIVALRGDPPEGIGERYVPHAGGYANAAELAKGISDIGDFEISVGCYPEKHPESADFSHDIDLLKAKIDNGASRAITQFFFEPDIYFKFLDRVRAAGIDIPIVPGVMLQPNFKGLKRMADMCGASIPSHLAEVFEGLDDDAKARELITAHFAAELVEKLAGEGVDQFHLYTLNRADLSIATCALLGVKPSIETNAA